MVTSGGLGDVPPAGSKGRAPDQRVGGAMGKAPQKLKLFAAQVPDLCPIRSLHAKLITGETNTKSRHICCFQQTQAVDVAVTHCFIIRAGTHFIFKRLISKN